MLYSRQLQQLHSSSYKAKTSNISDDGSEVKTLYGNEARPEPARRQRQPTAAAI